MSYISNLKFKQHRIFEDSSVNISEERFEANENVYTLLIGENATGKSELLSEIVKISRLYRNDVAHDTYKHKEGYDKALGLSLIREKGKADWPSKVLACSFNLNDKFPFSAGNKKDEEGFYKYLGIRTASNNAFIGKYKGIFFDAFIKIISDKRRQKNFKKAMDVLELPMRFKFTLSPARGMSKFFKSDFKRRALSENIIVDVKSELTKNNRFIPASVQKMQDDESYFLLVQSAIKIFSESIRFDERENSLAVEFDFTSMKKVTKKDLLEFNSIKHLVDAGIITVSEFYPDGRSSFISASSGQFNIINSIITIMSEIDDDCLLIIDEPEISLHPRWQVNYMSVIKEMLSSYKGCQVIIATHSHLLVTSMPIENSNVLVARKKKEGGVSFELLDASPSGWSSDMLLYSVFGVLTQNNQAFDYDIRTLASFMSSRDLSSGDFSMYKDALDRVRKYKLPGTDPLSVFVREAEKFFIEKEGV